DAGVIFRPDGLGHGPSAELALGPAKSPEVILIEKHVTLTRVDVRDKSRERVGDLSDPLALVDLLAQSGELRPQIGDLCSQLGKPGGRSACFGGRRQRGVWSWALHQDPPIPPRFLFHRSWESSHVIPIVGCSRPRRKYKSRTFVTPRRSGGLGLPFVVASAGPASEHGQE